MVSSREISLEIAAARRRAATSREQDRLKEVMQALRNRLDQPIEGV